MDVFFCPFYHSAELFFTEQFSNFTLQLSTCFPCLFAISEQIGKLPQLHNCFVISGLHIHKRHIDNKNNFLSDMIKCYYFIKQHQIHILKIFSIFHSTFCCRFTVSHIVVGKISDKTSRKGWKVFKSGAFILCKNFSEIIGGMFRFQFYISDFHFPMGAGNFQLWIKT